MQDSGSLIKTRTFQVNHCHNIHILNNRLIHLSTTFKVIRLTVRNSLRVCCTISFHCPNFHLTQTLSTEQLTTKRLLSNETVWPVERAWIFSSVAVAGTHHPNSNSIIKCFTETTIVCVRKPRKPASERASQA